MTRFRTLFGLLAMIICSLALLGPLAGGARAQVAPVATLHSIGALPDTKTIVVPSKVYPAHADGVTDDTAVVQSAINAAAAAGGGVVQFADKEFYFSGSLTVPAGVSLLGSALSPISHTEGFDANFGITNNTQAAALNSSLSLPIYDQAPASGHYPVHQTMFLVTANAGNESAAGFITEHSNDVVRGISFYYPNQARQGNVTAPATPTAYPPTIVIFFALNATVEDCEFLNVYDAIWSRGSMRTTILNVVGDAMHIGLESDGSGDCCRYENIHLGPWWSPGVAMPANGAIAVGANTDVAGWQYDHGTAFLMGRNDLTNCVNCFCFFYSIGWRFYNQTTENPGTVAGNPTSSWITMDNCSADVCRQPIQVEQSQWEGLLINNGCFTDTVPTGTCVYVTSTATGVVKFSNCIFSAIPGGRQALVSGPCRVSFTGCNFNDYVGNVGAQAGGASTVASIVSSAGELTLTGNTFEAYQGTHVWAQTGTARVLATGNMSMGNFIVQDDPGVMQTSGNYSQAPYQYTFNTSSYGSQIPTLFTKWTKDSALSGNFISDAGYGGIYSDSISGSAMTTPYAGGTVSRFAEMITVLSSAASGGGCEIYAVPGADTGYLERWESNTIQLYKFVSGTPTLLASSTGYPVGHTYYINTTVSTSGGNPTFNSTCSTDGGTPATLFGGAVTDSSSPLSATAYVGVRGDGGTGLGSTGAHPISFQVWP